MKNNYFFPKLHIVKKMAILSVAGLMFMNSLTATAANLSTEELNLLAEERKTLPIQSNEIANWPVGPEISAQAAILMEAETGTILYAKNIHEELYPASTTKMLTCLIAAENCDMNEMVSFSYDAVHSVPWDGSNMGIDAGQSLPMGECLYGIMVASANEVAAAVGEHIAGSTEAFVDMMNKRAKELGCLNSHFMNSNGLFDEDHYTSAYDLALIARAFFDQDALKRIGNTKTYHFIATSTQPDDFYKTNKLKLINGEYPYEGIIGGKTGYTGEARQTLVTGCEQNGMRLICVVLKEEAPAQFEDTITLFNYGYQNFTKQNISENDNRFSLKTSGFLYDNHTSLNQKSPVLSLAAKDYVIVPNMTDLNALNVRIDYNDDSLSEPEIATVHYSYSNVEVGLGHIILNKQVSSTYEFTEGANTSTISKQPDNTIFVNIKKLLLLVVSVAGLAIFIIVLYSIFFLRNDYRNKRERRKHRLRTKKNDRFQNKRSRQSLNFHRKRRK